MSKRTYIEIYCDHCGGADHFSPGNVDADARAVGWLITRNGEHYCNKGCRDAKKAADASKQNKQQAKS